MERNIPDSGEGTAVGGESGQDLAPSFLDPLDLG